MAKDQKTNSPESDSVPEMDRIRDLVFGPQMRDYDQRFQTVGRDLTRIQQQLDQLADQLSQQDGDQKKKLQDLRREVRQADDDLRAELRQAAQTLTNEKVDRVTLGELFVELGTHLKSGGFLSDVLKNINSIK